MAAFMDGLEKKGKIDMSISKVMKRSTALFIAAIVLITGSFAAAGSGEVFAAKKVPLKKIKLSKTSVKMREGKSLKLTVKYTPKKTTVKKTVKWASNKKSVVTVKNGILRAKRPGAATITAKVGSRKATCKVRVTGKKSDQEDPSYLDPQEAYDALNAFRTQKNVWVWDYDDETKIYFNTTESNTLMPLIRDEALEKTALIRAAEIAERFSHTRPDNTICFTIYPSDLITYGENLAYGYRSGKDITELWKETKCDYSGQGHRRNMLDPEFTIVGIAGYKMNGTTYWVQAFGAR